MVGLVLDVRSNKRVVLQEINHAGAGGLWAELINNRGKACEQSALTLS